jgi:hypothetical protein
MEPVSLPDMVTEQEHILAQVRIHVQSTTAELFSCPNSNILVNRLPRYLLDRSSLPHKANNH